MLLFTFFNHFGRYLLFIKGVFSKPEQLRVYVRRTLDEMYVIGNGSLTIVVIISLFTGAVTTVQTGYQLISSWFSRSVIGSIVSDSVMMELAPTITSLVLAGKIGSSIASEIGTMRVTEQIDALDVMGINSRGYLALPKIVAGLIMIPCLVIIAMFLGITGGYFAGKLSGILTPEQFMEGAQRSFRVFTLEFSIIKSFTYALIITSVSAYHGYEVRGGAREVGQASTRAVVYSCELILFSDYILAQLLL
jgi:phospholipid/cholesterol/gamma-HCH transport system permease protein